MTLYLGDCIEKMSEIPDGSVDMILCDLPYGTTACKWDTIIPLNELWNHYDRLINGSGAIALFGTQPFTSLLIQSNSDIFKYMWYWRKKRPSGFVNANNMPLKDIEEISVFSKGAVANGAKDKMPYNPQGVVRVDKKWARPKKYFSDGGVNPTRESHGLTKTIKFENYPRQVLDFSMHNRGLLHPTQKPVPLLEYLIKTYTSEGGVVLDNAMGSGSTGVACVNTGRKFIGIELDKKYYHISCQRIKDALHIVC